MSTMETDQAAPVESSVRLRQTADMRQEGRAALGVPRVTPQKFVDHEMRNLIGLVRRLLIDNKNFESREDRGRYLPGYAFRDQNSDLAREISASSFARGWLRETADFILKRLAQTHEVVVDMAADAKPDASRLWLARIEGTDWTRLVRADDAEKAVDWCCRYLEHAECRTGEIDLIVTHLPPEDAMTDGVLELDRCESKRLRIELPQIALSEDVLDPLPSP